MCSRRSRRDRLRNPGTRSIRFSAGVVVKNDPPGPRAPYLRPRKARHAPRRATSSKRNGLKANDSEAIYAISGLRIGPPDSGGVVPPSATLEDQHSNLLWQSSEKHLGSPDPCPIAWGSSSSTACSSLARRSCSTLELTGLTERPSAGHQSSDTATYCWSRSRSGLHHSGS